MTKQLYFTACRRCGKDFFVTANRLGKAKYCSSECYHAEPVQRPKRSARPWQPRFLSKIDKTPGFGPEGTCWKWIGTTNPNGRYGLFFRAESVPQINGAHRVSWEFHKGPIPDGLDVLHTCDFKLCVHPEHLFLGTTQDNTADCVAKGRNAMGTRQPQAKLTEADIPRICQSWNEGKSMQDLATAYGVSATIIHKIVRGLAWKHVKR